jgi:uncharacterized membrane protein
MNLAITLLRIIHIMAVFSWAAMGLFVTFYVMPAAAHAGDNGLRFLKMLYNRTSYNMVIGIAALLTTLAGVLLYLTNDPYNKFSQTGQIVLGIGSVAGLLSFGHGLTANRKISEAYGKALAINIPDGDQPISEAARPELAQLAKKLVVNGRIGSVLMIIALVGMGAARYL